MHASCRFPSSRDRRRENQVLVAGPWCRHRSGRRVVDKVRLRPDQNNGQLSHDTVLVIKTYHLVDECSDLIWEVRELEISTSPSAFSSDTL